MFKLNKKWSLEENKSNKLGHKVHVLGISHLPEKRTRFINLSQNIKCSIRYEIRYQKGIYKYLFQ